MPDSLDHLKAALADRFAVTRELGRGGMATVYLAEDTKHRRQVAVKVLRPELAQAIGATRFLHEIEIAARLTHPNILPLHDSGVADGLFYYVMPYVDGQSLREHLNREQQLPVGHALRIAGEVAEALHHAHTCGVIHRDIKPENILLMSGHAMLSDFGIARALDAAGGRLTDTGLALGTPVYMSPEQAAGEQDVDARTDIYALACVLYEMLAGEPPYDGPSKQAIIAKQVTAPVPSVRNVRDTVPLAVDQALRKALAKARADRFESAAAFADALTGPPATARPSSARSVAVLPFANLGATPDTEYFADGVTEDVIAQLSKIRALKVISRTSIMPFKNQAPNLREIGVQLGVGTLLQGSVRRDQDRVRIVAQLINAETHEHLWAETYDRALTDVFAIQSDVALRIAAALEAELSPDEHARLKAHATTHSPIPEAYEAYLRGRFHWYQHTPEHLETALRYFQVALEKDPDYALAHGAIADTWGARTFLGLVAPRDAYARVKAGVLRALELDDSRAETHDLMGRVRLWYEWDWGNAEREFQRSIQLNANYADVHVFYAWLLNATSRWEEARAHIDRALELDPLNVYFQWFLGFGLFLQRRFDSAVRQFRRTLQMEPSALLAHAGLWSTYHQMSLHDEALAEARRYFEGLGDQDVTSALAGGSAKGGYAGAMRRAAETLAARFARTYVPPTQVARLYAYADEADLAFQWLETAYAERDFEMVYLGVHPAWELLRSDRRYQDLVGRLKLSG